MGHHHPLFERLKKLGRSRAQQPPSRVVPAKEAVRKLIDAAKMSCNEAVRASRRARWALLSMRQYFDGIKKIPHPEEAAKQLSRRTHAADPVNR
jgi:hypothetical protein